MTSDAHGRTALVTGAARSIGQGIAVELARRGHDIVGVDIRPCDETAELVEAAGGALRWFPADVGDPDRVDAIAAELDGAVDVLVNNAAIIFEADIEGHSYEDFQRLMRTNVDSAFLFCRAFVGPMRRRGWGRIVNISSTQSSSNVRASAAYMTSKMAIVGLTRGVANDVAADGVTVNAVAPTLAVTAATQRLHPEVFEAVAQMQAIQRSTTVDDVAKAVAFLVSDDAEFITAQTVVVDGGHTRTAP